MSHKVPSAFPRQAYSRELHFLWVQKHSILNTGKTIDSDVDISNSGTYPDAAGWWRTRVEPITGSADFAQGIVQIKNSIDN